MARIPNTGSYRPLGEQLEDIPIGYIKFKEAVELAGNALFGSEWTGAEGEARSASERHDQNIQAARREAGLNNLPQKEREDYERGIRYAEEYPDDIPFYGDPPNLSLSDGEMAEIQERFKEKHGSETNARQRLATAIHDLLDKFRANPLAPRAATDRGRFSIIPVDTWDTGIEKSIYPNGYITFQGNNGMMDGWVYLPKGDLEEWYDRSKREAEVKEQPKLGARKNEPETRKLSGFPKRVRESQKPAIKKEFRAFVWKIIESQRRYPNRDDAREFCRQNEHRQGDGAAFPKELLDSLPVPWRNEPGNRRALTPKTISEIKSNF